MLPFKKLTIEFGILILVTAGVCAITVMLVPAGRTTSVRDLGPGRPFTVRRATGSVVAFDRVQEKYVHLREGMKIQACDLRTGPAGSMTLEGEGLSLTLSDGARARVRDGDEAVDFNLLAGRALLHLMTGTSVSVGSPHGTFRGTGSAFRLGVDASGTEVEVKSGSVEAASLDTTEVIAEGAHQRFGSEPVTLPEVPFSLTDSGSTGGTLSVPNREGKKTNLRVDELDVQVIIDGRIALTRIEQIFANDTDRRCEGRYAFVLPPGATLSRYAMYTSETRLVEGEIVDRQRGKHIYTEIVRRMQDPALVEWQQGNLFTARVFPIEPRSKKRILFSYTQVLPRR
ncbi:MAG: VIT domain-containing protein, partial [Planctomycetota bacterium]